MSLFKKVKFQGNEYIMNTDHTQGSTITTPEAYTNSELSYAHLFDNGEIKRYGEVIGHREDIEYTGEVVEVKEGDLLMLLSNMARDGFFNRGA